MFLLLKLWKEYIILFLMSWAFATKNVTKILDCEVMAFIHSGRENWRGLSVLLGIFYWSKQQKVLLSSLGFQNLSFCFFAKFKKKKKRGLERQFDDFQSKQIQAICKEINNLYKVKDKLFLDINTNMLIIAVLVFLISLLFKPLSFIFDLWPYRLLCINIHYFH